MISIIIVHPPRVSDVLLPLSSPARVLLLWLSVLHCWTPLISCLVSFCPHEDQKISCTTGQPCCRIPRTETSSISNPTKP